jgi:streptogramin lyase
MSIRTVAIVASAALAVTLAAPPASAAAHRPVAPTSFDLPAGFRPEGIAIGRLPYAFLGSLADGDIYRVDLFTGRGRVLSEGPGTPSVGMKVDGRGRLFVAGGSGGDARVIDAPTGTVLKSYPMQTVPAFINDVTLTGGAAWFTDSTNPTLFRLPLDLSADPAAVPLTGEIEYTTSGSGVNANGIVPTPDGRALIIVQSTTGKLFHTTHAGVTTEIDLGGESVPNGDGLWLRGETLYVVQNFQNVVAEIELNRAGTVGEVVSRTGDPRFDVPTTIAEYGGRFYLPNARFSTTPTPTTPYDVVAIPIP